MMSSDLNTPGSGSKQPGTFNVESKMEKISRHCAFCLKFLPPEEVKFCGKCTRRAYCSRKCQHSDWSSRCEGSQCHKNWCGLIYGEEDLDWKITSVEGKGLGVIALHPIAKHSRVMVEGFYRSPKNEPAFLDLMPANGSLDDKFSLNSLGCGSNKLFVSLALCLRISRVNHNCNSNAEHFFDENLKVKILVASRDIEEGEEICISYQPINEVAQDLSPEAGRLVLQIKWGIICPKDCYCYDESMTKLIKESVLLDKRIFELGSKGQCENAMRSVNTLIGNMEIFGGSFGNWERVLFDGFQIGIMKRKTLPLAMGFLKKAYDMACTAQHPMSDETLKYGSYLKNPNHHPNYLFRD